MVMNNVMFQVYHFCFTSTSGISEPVVVAVGGSIKKDIKLPIYKFICSSVIIARSIHYFVLVVPKDELLMVHVQVLNATFYYATTFVVH